MSKKIEEQNKLLLIDGNSIMNRAFYGIPDLTNSEGLHTNAVYGFLNILFKSLDEENADHIVVAFDLKAPTFRHEKFKDYKGNRKGMPDELREQMPLIKEVLHKMNVTISEIEGYEADDVLGTLSVQGEKQGMDVTILSGDKDLLQLATDKVKISIPKTRHGSTNIEHYFANDVKKTYNVTPKQFVDVKGLMGDPSDNIPGVPGIGEKTAIKIISQFKSIEEAYDHVDELPKRASNQLKEFFDQALLSKELATICIDCQPDVLISDCTIEDIFSKEAYQVFKQLEFKSLLDRFDVSSSDTMEKQLQYIMIEEKQQLESLLVENKIIYYLQEDQDFVVLSFIIDDTKAYYTDSELMDKKQIIELVSEILQDKEKQIVTHNLKEQLHLLSMNLELGNQTVFDCSLASYLLNPVKESYELDDISNEILKQSFLSKDEFLGKGRNKKSLEDIPCKDRVEYFCKGSQILLESADIIQEQLVENELLDLYKNIELPLVYVLKSMESLGIRVDSTKLKEYGNRLKEQLNTIEEEIYQLAGDTFNINSPKQLGVVLFENLQLPVIKKTKTGYSTAADVLDKLYDKHLIIPKIIEYRQLSKLKSTYADGLFDYIEDDGRIHSHFRQQVTSTGRISSTEPNLQNIPIKLDLGREIRKVFIPEDGYEFIDADYSQIELRLLAHLSGDETFIDAFNKNLDIHSITASQVFHVPFEQVTPLQRRNAKAVNFGIVYGISAFGLSRDLNITRKEATEYIDQYFEKYPKVKAFLDESVDNAKINGYVKTMFNRIRHIPELKSSNFMQRSFGERIAMNTPIQGSAADIIKIAMIQVYKKLKQKGFLSRLILQVHDELLIEAHKDEVEEVKKILVEEMENAVKISVPLTVDAHVGASWFDAK